MYAGDYNDNFEPASYNAGWTQTDPIEFDGTLLSQAAQLGFATNSINNTTAGSITPSVWTCPNRPTLPATAGGGVWAMGYQYFGCVTNWYWNGNAYPSASPFKTTTAKSSWMLASDLVLKFATTAGPIAWGDSAQAPDSGYASLPAHKKGDVYKRQRPHLCGSARTALFGTPAH